MTETEEPQFTSLSARIAALNKQGVGKSLQAQSTSTTGKRPPPPPPPSGNRPSLPSRTQTINNPPIVSYGSSVAKQLNNTPLGTRGQPLLPPPPVDRDQPLLLTNGTPPLPARNGPPPLPSRKASQPSPNLPPRRTSTQLTPNTQVVRRASNSSFSSTISGMSLGQNGSITSASSVGSERKLPPALGDAKLPPLPPTKREREERERANQANQMPVLTTTKSAPSGQLQLRGPPPVDRDGPPRMPPRPKMPPRPSTGQLEEVPPPMPARPGNNVSEEDNAPAQPSRRLPPPGAARSILSMGFGNKPSTNGNHASNETPNPAPRPIPTLRPTGPAVVELTSEDFDRSIRGKFAFVEFFGPKCINCERLAPDWNQLGADFAFASDRLIIAKVNMEENKSFFRITSDADGYTRYPTLIFFDGDREKRERYEDEKELDSLTRYLERKTGIKASDAALAPKSNGAPPRINLSSKPSASQVRAVQSRPAPATPPTSGCLICRDFSEPDRVAAQYPRESLPQRDAISYLADVLCGPFSSYTDKARAIFTWMHYNIKYDVDAFFGNRVKHVEPKDTIASGLAVCGGYAGAYVAIALKAGMEAVMVTGHGKGFGYDSMKPGDPIPPCSPTGHAWNAVRIDGGEWKLIDACWGAGSLGAGNTYSQKFSPTQFTRSNDDFGLKHFPQDKKYFYRSDGRALTWEEYILGPNRGEGPQIYGNGDEHGINQFSFQPALRHISLSASPVVRFQFSKACEHWDHEVNGNGKPYLLILIIEGKGGKKADYVPFDSNDFWWWADVKSEDLGREGQSVKLMTVDNFDGRSGRGLTKKEFEGKKGRCAMGPFSGIAAWDLVA